MWNYAFIWIMIILYTCIINFQKIQIPTTNQYFSRETASVWVKIS